MFEFGERIGWELQNVDEKLINDFCSRIGVKKQVLKVWLHNNNKKKNQPTTDTLPEGAIHKILSNLNYVEASRMTILSRTWLQAWLTNPNLLFVACSGAEERAEWSTRGKIDIDIVDKIIKRYRDEKIPIDKFELSIDIGKPTGYIFFSIDKWFDIALQNGFEVRNLQNIRSLHIMIEKKQSVEIEAPTLEYLSYSSYSLDELDIVEYPNLESLELSGSFASRRFKIGRSKSLRVLKINNLRINNCQKIEVDAPNLVSLEYEGDYLPQLKLAKESSKFKNLIFNSNKHSLDDKWFCRLIEFLSNSTSWSQVSIQVSVDIYRCGEINMEHLKRHYRVSTPQVDVLDVIIEPRDDSPTFVDALLWCFRPRRLNISSSFKIIIYLISRLLYMKNSSDSTSHEDEPQLVQLKEVRAYKFDGKNESWHPVKPKSMKLKTGDPNNIEKFYFLLNW
uniref:ZF-HD homeobox protein n=1 Tax=Solanum tuberosum TaxID=4113 RepID=M1DS32_SOLTU